MPDETPHVPLWKQLAGAVTGSVIAMALYGVYTWTLPFVTGVAQYAHETAAETVLPEADVVPDTTDAAQFAAEAQGLSFAPLAAALIAEMEPEPADVVEPASVAEPEPAPIAADPWRPAPPDTSPFVADASRTMTDMPPLPAHMPTPESPFAVSATGHAGAPDLPNSGPPALIAVAVAGAVAGARRVRRTSR